MSLKKNQKGFTLIEAMIAVSISAIIFISLIDAFQAAFNIWKSGNFDLFFFKKVNKEIPILEDKLKGATHIQGISLAADNEAFIQYTNSQNQLITIYYNTLLNR